MFQIEGEGGNKRGGWQISTKIITEEGAINREAWKNTAIRNIIEIKPSILWKYQQKEHKKCKGSLSTWRLTSKTEPIYAHKRDSYK